MCAFGPTTSLSLALSPTESSSSSLLPALFILSTRPPPPPPHKDEQDAVAVEEVWVRLVGGILECRWAATGRPASVSLYTLKCPSFALSTHPCVCVCVCVCVPKEVMRARTRARAHTHTQASGEVHLGNELFIHAIPPLKEKAAPSPMCPPANHLQAVLENGLVGPLLRIVCQLLFLNLCVCVCVCARAHKGLGSRFSGPQFRSEGVVCLCTCISPPLSLSLPLGSKCRGTWR